MVNGGPDFSGVSLKDCLENSTQNKRAAELSYWQINLSAGEVLIYIEILCWLLRISLLKLMTS